MPPPRVCLSVCLSVVPGPNEVSRLSPPHAPTTGPEQQGQGPRASALRCQSKQTFPSFQLMTSGILSQLREANPPTVLWTGLGQSLCDPAGTLGCISLQISRVFSSVLGHLPSKPFSFSLHLPVFLPYFCSLACFLSFSFSFSQTHQ